MLKILERLLEAGKISKEVANEIDGDISAEFSKLRDESANWRVKYQTLNKTFEEVQNSKNELEKELKNLDERIQKAKEEGKSELAKELEAERLSKQELQQKLNSLEESNKNYRIETTLNKALSKFEVIDMEFMKDALKQKIVVDDSGDIKLKDGDSVVDLESGLKSIFEAKPNLLKPKGKTGSGSSGGSGSYSGKSFSEMSLDERMELYKNDPKTYEILKGSK